VSASAPRRLLLAVRLLWAAACGVVFGGLTAELALQIDRRAAELGAAGLAERNVFDVGAVREASGQALWQVPGQSYWPGAGSRWRSRATLRDRDQQPRLSRPGGLAPEAGGRLPGALGTMECLKDDTGSRASRQTRRA
jgi:hypothetical protein